MKKKALYITAFFVLLSVAAAYSQCAMCKAAAESSLEANSKSVAKGLNSGILFLMAIPYLVVGIIFRKDLIQFIKNLRSKEKTGINKKSLNNLTFAITFITCAVVLFAVFISFYKPV
ncbi:MAG TPA: hypothetical protein VNY73_11220 [Bacteroidia bacterium]|nr:hypothetical protein [Bacteroidia bacterium]